MIRRLLISIFIFHIYSKKSIINRVEINRHEKLMDQVGIVTSVFGKCWYVILDGIDKGCTL